MVGGRGVVMSRAVRARPGGLRNDLCAAFTRGAFARPALKQVFAFRRMVARAFPVETVRVSVKAKWLEE